MYTQRVYILFHYLLRIVFFFIVGRGSKIIYQLCVSAMVNELLNC